MGVQFSDMSDEEKQDLDDRWNRTFADLVKKQLGTYVIDRWNGQRTTPYRWNGYEFGFQPYLEGQAALDAYKAQRPGPYFIFDESMEVCWRCESAIYSDLTRLGDDFYVVHHKLRWSMAFTHEMNWVGPFFATAAPLAP